MITKPDKNKARLKRHVRVRAKISGTPECPRLDVFRSAAMQIFTHRLSTM